MRLHMGSADDENVGLQEVLPSHHAPSQRLSRSDVHFPLATPRKRNPSIPLLTHAQTEDGQSSGVPKIRASSKHDFDYADSAEQQLVSNAKQKEEAEEEEREGEDSCLIMDNPQESRHTNIQDLPEELQKRILDYIFGDLRPVNAASTSTGLSHRMRHPRRKAVSELALISLDMRIMVQERIYRHIKIKATKDGLQQATKWFMNHHHLAHYVRHIEYWVPVWGDKTSALHPMTQNPGQILLNDFAEHGPPAGHDIPTVQFKLSTSSASLSQIFEHLGQHFPEASIFTLEGGHCKNSTRIQHFLPNLFSQQMSKHLRVLPNIRVFAMRGAWNIMRSHDDWNNIQEALPCLSEWHCGYAKPRSEAYNTINEILLQLPTGLRHVDISLDSMFSKDDTVLGSSPCGKSHHICEQLGRIAPQLESLSYTGKTCECFWSAALESVERDRTTANKLKSLDIVVKSCCRRRVKSKDMVTGDVLVEELGGIMADGAGIGNLVFINAFERLVMGALDGMASMTSLSRVKIRYIDLDSPCQQLNPYWHVENNAVTGIWNDRIVEKLTEVRPGLHYEKLEDGIGGENSNAAKKDDDPFEWTRSNNVAGIPSSSGGVNALYPRTIPKSINTSSYRIIAEARTS
ncbi:hypothetical protein H2198_001455 [Neophaeococcomyces mojaviensis]|uniref:Uncharacterized protein n=1 Tax=Neophaeococcomyces mojaviensis TaxID=3383035 RepID=A0ACC3AGY9_9EURO|nr:hypothetical protein H2198_001455 [Knufia sp. JES_112]